MQRGCRIKNNATAPFYLAELSKIRPSRHPEPCLFIRLPKDLAFRRAVHNQNMSFSQFGVNSPIELGEVSAEG